MPDKPQDPSLAEKLADALPQDSQFKFYHISTPPTKAPAIYSAPPGAKPEKTYLESHFLNVSIRPGDGPDAKEVLILAIEVLIYSTRFLTTVFVSKADSTGYLNLLSLPKRHASPLRTIASTFLEYLVEKRRRDGVKLVVSLFARASDQYLFPGSVENRSKHVSDDRQLVKWWCRVLDPVLRKYKGEDEGEGQKEEQPAEDVTSQAYLIVPGEDSILSFLPQDVRLSPSLRRRWTHGHPLRELARNPALPPRCLIPHFPDDPKARFLVDLDDELPATQSSQTQDSPSKRGSGKWRSVTSLEQFWEMMAFRQECSSGRLVGFIWVVFTPTSQPTSSDLNDSQTPSKLSTSSSSVLPPTISTPHTSPSPDPPPPPHQHQRRRKPSPSRRKTLKGPIIPRTPKIKSSSSHTAIRAGSAHCTSAPTSRDEIVLCERDYAKANEVLLRLDFANLEVARCSSRTWVEEVRVLSQRQGAWGWDVVGRKERDGGVEMGVKRKGEGDGVNMMVVEKKVKNVRDGAVEDRSRECGNGDGNGVNVLGMGVVRKKPKVA